MKKTVFRISIVLIISACVLAFFIFDVSDLISLKYLKSRQEEFHRLYQGHPVLVLAIYFFVYVLIASLSLPMATLLTIAAGAIFGLWVGTVVVSFASTIGATAAFLAARFLLRDMIQDRFSKKLRRINQGIKREGGFYLFALRLVPILPFFVVNAGMGLTPLRTRTFFWVSQLGMLPSTLAYVNAGTELAHIDSIKQILSFRLLASFAILGTLPLFSKAAVNLLRRKRIYKNFSRPRSFDYNVVVIGAGSGGLIAAHIAAALKAKVALVERQRMGGDCLYTGCVPSKTLIRSARVVALARRAKDFGLSISVDFDFQEIMERIDRVIHAIEPHDSQERYQGLGVACFAGDAQIKSPYAVEVEGQILTAKNIVIATGAGPAIPAIAGLNSIRFFTTDTIWQLRSLPKRLLILGGGPVGCELAQAFARLGSAVTMIEKENRILTREDEEASLLIMDSLRQDGVKVLTGHQIRRISAGNLLAETSDGAVSIEFDDVLVALGRQADVTGFGLDRLGVELREDGAIAADEFMRTNYPNIFACGDVTGPYQFTHMAAHQAWFAAVNALFQPFKKFSIDYDAVPWATFTDPELARAGLSEDEAKRKEKAYEVVRFDFKNLDRAIIEEEGIGFIKVLVKKNKDKILGVTIAGPRASELIAPFVMAMRHGLGLNAILNTIHIYPTLMEANRHVAGEWKRKTAPPGILKLLERFHAWRRS